MFSPQFIFSNRIVNNLIELEKAVLVADLAPLQVDWETKIKLECLSKRAYSVLHYLDCQLDIDDISKIVKDDPGRDDKPTQVALRIGVVAKEKDVQKAINWLNSYRLVSQTAYLTKKFKQEIFGEKDLKTINSLLGERVVCSNSLGEYRGKDSLEYPEIKSPAPIEVSYQMEDLFSWFKSVSKSDIHSVIKAGIVLFEIMRIRPFEENNLSASLFFSSLTMANDGYGMKEMWPFEEDLLKNKSRFGEIFSQTVDSEDLTGWLEYFTKTLSESAEKTRVKIMNLVGDRPVFKSEVGKVISLSEREITIMEEMTIQGEMTIKEIRGILPMVSDDTILRDIKDLILKKLLRKKGKTKGAVYVLGRVKGFK
ncbi:MAG TPA: Fic family protein [Spirochaetia bacterium]|nr:Fic family protein [Spirochaetia bacterium]